MTNPLAKLDRATHMLAEAKTLDEIKNIMDVAEAARTYARAARLGLQAYNHAAEIKVRAERKAGEFLKRLERIPGGKGRFTAHSNVERAVSQYSDVLKEYAIPTTSAHRWQQLADMPELVFEKHLEDSVGEKPITTSGVLKELKTSQRKQEREAVANKAKAIPLSKRWHVHHGDMTTIKLDRQFNFIVTDPPYPKEYLHLYAEVARRANEWLFDGGLLIAMCGQSYLNQIYSMMSEHLTYYWTAAYLTPGQPTPLRQVNVNSTWKPLLIFSKGKYNGKIFGDVFVSDGNDKSLHKWGQSESGMYDIISKIVLEGQSILDPFCGAGTTLVAGLKHNCFVTGIELEEANVNISKGRLAEL